MARWNTIARGAAFAAAASLVLAACSSGDDDPDTTPGGETTPGADGGSTDPLKIGSLLPLTGALAYLGPPEVAGVDLAINEINDAGGVLGNPVQHIGGDSSDTDNTQVATQTVTGHLAEGVSVIVGAASSAVTYNVIDDIVAAGVVQISPANTSPGLSGYSDYFFRTAPSDLLQGDVLANLIIEDGHESVGILVFNEDYGVGLRDVVVEVLEENDVEVTYGQAGQEFDTNASNFSAEVQAVLATDPDAIAIIAFDQTKQIIPDLLASGFDGSQLYFTDGNTADYSNDLPAGAIEGSKGTIPGFDASEDFKQSLNDAYGSALDSYAYGAESYDAVMLVALAAVRGGGTDGATIAANMHAVSGADGGTECSGFADCAALLEDGEEINYQAVSGVGPFNEDNDPSDAAIGIFVYDENNVPVWTR